MANIMRIGGGGGGKPRKLLSSIANGSAVSVLEDGVLTQFIISHNYEPDLNGAGRTLFVRKKGYDLRQFHSSNVNAFATSSLYAWLNGDYKAKLSARVQAEMGITVYPNTQSGSKTAITGGGAVFIASLTELGLKDGAGSPVEGTTLPIASLLTICYDESNNAVNQWTRTPVENETQRVYFASSAGTAGAVAATSSLASRPCFTLPSDMALRPEPLPDGSWALADEEFLFDTETAKTTPKSGVTYTNGIADLDAATLHEIGKAISSNPKITNETSVVYYDSGSVHRKISIGDTYNVDYIDYVWENGSGPLAVNIIGFNHDDLSLSTAYETPTATGKAGFTFQMTNCFKGTTQMESTAINRNGWTSCRMRTLMTPDFFRGFGELGNVIKAVKKLTSAGNKSAVINTTDDNLFLLSEVEILGTHPTSFAGEGNQYAYYKAGNSKVKKVSGSASTWWERSPVYVLTDAFCCIYSDGTESNAKANTYYGVSFAYCI